MDGDDIEIFQSILQFLNRHNLTKLKAVLWTVHPGTIRQDATLNKQAKLINQFADRDIWNNVIIICTIIIALVDSSRQMALFWQYSIGEFGWPRPA